MATIPTQNPVPSESPRDLKFNAGKIDEFVTSFVLTYTDRLGRDHLTIEGLKDLIERAIKAFGFITMDSFEDGATLDNSSQVLRWESNGEYYRWDGSFPKVVPAASTPETSGGIGTGAWLSVGDAALRSNLSSDVDEEGDALVAVKQPFAGSAARTQHDKNSEIISSMDVANMSGDGVTNDDLAFSVLESELTRRPINLLDKVYLVSSVPNKHIYYNGSFRLNKTVTTSGNPTPYTWDCKQSLPDSAIPLSIPSRDYRGSMATQAYYISTSGGQSIAFDEPNAVMYIMFFDNSTGSERSYLSAYDMSMRYPQPATALWSTNPSALLGHQGLGLEYVTNSVPKLWGSCRYDVINSPIGHRQVVRFNAIDAADIYNVEQFTLFGEEFSYTGNATMCAVSYDQKYLVACGRKTSRSFWVRVFSLDNLTAGGAGDYSDSFLYEFQVDQDILADDANGNFTPIQNMACDGSHIYIVAGNSGLTQKKIHQYSLAGIKCDINNTISVGLTNATSDGSTHEPEGICIYRPQGAPKPMLAYLTISASGNRTRIWDMGYSPQVVSGSWTPIGTSVNNIATLSTYVCNYQRIGNVVNFSGRVNIRNTIAGVFEFQLSLPTYINAISLTQAQGVFIGEASEGGRIQLDTATSTLDFLGKSAANVTVAYSFSGSYRLSN